MNIQHSPRKTSAELEHSLDELDTAIRSIDRGTQQVLTPTTESENHRKAIVSLVDNLATNLTEKIEMLKQTLSRIEQQVLTSAERSRSVLQDHVGICERVSDEVKHMAQVIADLERDTHES
jgi:methyl-accepting chemotaxis protein